MADVWAPTAPTGARACAGRRDPSVVRSSLSRRCPCLSACTFRFRLSVVATVECAETAIKGIACLAATMAQVRRTSASYRKRPSIFLLGPFSANWSLIRYRTRRESATSKPLDCFKPQRGIAVDLSLDPSVDHLLHCVSTYDHRFFLTCWRSPNGRER